jgi:hypothetical protein
MSADQLVSISKGRKVSPTQKCALVRHINYSVIYSLIFAVFKKIAAKTANIFAYIRCRYSMSLRIYSIFAVSEYISIFAVFAAIFFLPIFLSACTAGWLIRQDEEMSNEV